MKYKFTKYTGCTTANFLINEKSLSDHSKEEIDSILEYLFLKIKEECIPLENVVELFQPDDIEYSDYECDTCGDTTTETIWKI